MNPFPQFLNITPVLPSSDIERDLKWYLEKTGFELHFQNDGYAGMKNGGAVIRIFVKNIKVLFEEFVERGTVSSDKLILNTAWGTHEFGCFDLNKNAIFL